MKDVINNSLALRVIGKKFSKATFLSSLLIILYYTIFYRNEFNTMPVDVLLKNTNRFKELALAVIDTELNAVSRLKNEINQEFIKACECLLECQGRVVVIGMGKSGHIGRKIAATFASTGSPAFFVHPSEAKHGDIGMITKNDVALIFSYSGETEEIITILPFLKRFNIPMIAITGHPTSTIAKASTINLNAMVDKEACPLNSAPTASTTAALVLGDALAIALLEARGFTKEDFALSHPKGSLGRRLLLHVEDVMHQGSAIPMVDKEATISEALVEMTSKRLGMTAIIDKQRRLIGIFTDGDLRRTIDKDLDIKQAKITAVMTSKPVFIHTGLLAAEVLQLMEAKKINGVFVVNNTQKVIGALNMHDLLRSGVL